MARPRNAVPGYRKHKQSGQAAVDVRRDDGTRTTMLLGAYGSAASKAEYARLVALLNTNGGKLPRPSAAGAPPGDITVSELIASFVEKKADVDYRNPDGTLSTEHAAVALACRPLLAMFGPTLVSEFSAIHLEAVRTAMASGAWMTDAERADRHRRGKAIGWCRTNINRAVSRLRGALRWGVARGLVPASTVTSLECLTPLRMGRGGARESRPVTPVDEAIVEATLPFLPPTVADIVRLLLWSGCRVGELTSMRGGDVDRSGEVWLYKPPQHKTAYRGHRRTIAFGPKCQLVLRRHLPENPAEVVFSPAKQRDALNAAKRERRASPVPPSQRDRSSPDAVRVPGDRYDPRAVNHAIARACRKAGVEKWHAHQLRHTAALLIEREHGIEAARAVLGHKTLNMSAHYAGVDAKRAAEVAAACG